MTGRAITGLPDRSGLDDELTGSELVEGWFGRLLANWLLANWLLADWLLADWLLSDWLLADWLLADWLLADWLLANWLLANWLLANWLLFQSWGEALGAADGGYGLAVGVVGMAWLNSKPALGIVACGVWDCIGVSAGMGPVDDRSSRNGDSFSSGRSPASGVTGASRTLSGIIASSGTVFLGG